MDTELVLRARRGDRDAFDLVLGRMIDRMYRIAALILRDVDLAEDSVQESLIRCWRELPSLRDASRFEAWLQRILVNEVRDQYRRRQRSKAHLAVLRVEPTAGDPLDHVPDRDLLDRAFERLSLAHRTIVVLHFHAGLTVEEAARTLGIPLGTAKSRLHYATDALRAVLEADARGEAVREATA